MVMMSLIITFLYIKNDPNELFMLVRHNLEHIKPIRFSPAC